MELARGLDTRRNGDVLPTSGCWLRGDQSIDELSQLAQRCHSCCGFVGHDDMEDVIDLEHVLGSCQRIVVVACKRRVGLDRLDVHAELRTDERFESFQCAQAFRFAVMASRCALQQGR